MRDDKPKKPKPRPTTTDRLRNFYQSGDETGKTKPDRDGETFAGLERKKRRDDQ